MTIEKPEEKNISKTDKNSQTTKKWNYSSEFARYKGRKFQNLRDFATEGDSSFINEEKSLLKNNPVKSLEKEIEFLNKKLNEEQISENKQYIEKKIKELERMKNNLLELNKEKLGSKNLKMNPEEILGKTG